jgi:hypothetical protein
MRRVSFCDDRNCHPSLGGVQRLVGSPEMHFANLLLSAICFHSSTLVLAPSPWLGTCNNIPQESVHGANGQNNSIPGYGYPWLLAD